MSEWKCNKCGLIIDQPKEYISKCYECGGIFYEVKTPPPDEETN